MMRLLTKMLKILVALVLIYTALGFITLPLFIKQQLPGMVNEATHGHLTVYDISFNPFTFELEVEDVEFRDPQWQELVKVESLYVDVDVMDLLHQELHVNNLTISGITVTLNQFTDGGFTTDWLARLPEFDGVDEERVLSTAFRMNITDITMDHAALNLATHRVHVGALAVVSPALDVGKEAAAMPRVTSKVKEPKTTETTSQGEPWQVDLGSFELHRGALNYQDETLESPVRLSLEALALTVNDISTRMTPLEYKISMLVQGDGIAKASGRFDPKAMQQQGSFELQNIPLVPISPYVEALSYIALKNGIVSVSGETLVALKDGAPDVRFKGKAGLQRFKAVDTHDNTLLAAVTEVTAAPIDYNTTDLYIESVGIDGLYANAVVDANKSFNFAQLVKTDGVQAVNEGNASVHVEQNMTSKPSLNVKIDRVVVSGSNADFADFSLPLQFQTHVTEMEGSVTGVASKLTGISHVDFKGIVDAYGDARLEGSLNAGDPKHFTDLSVVFRNLTLNRYSPYSVKFVGRKIDEGRLFLDLGYKILDHKLKGANKIHIKKIRLGERVESEGAIDLPLDLAIALLEDREGVIDVDLPVEGDLENPKFKYGAALWKAFVNLLTNVATAPFRFLGNMLGIEGKKLEYVEFEPGKAKLLPPEREKLDALGDALVKRPGLSLRVGGAYHKTRDSEVLQRAKAKALVIEKNGGKEVENAPLELLETLNAAHMEAGEIEALRTAKRQEFEDETLFTQMYRQELMQRLSSVQEVNATALNELAESRRNIVTDYLKSQKQVDAERVVDGEVSVHQKGEAKWIRCELGIEAVKE